MPPELAAAAGIHDIPSEHNLGKSDALQNDVGKGAARVRPPLVFTMFYHPSDMLGEAPNLRLHQYRKKSRVLEL